jgi:hypothetical protein
MDYCLAGNVDYFSLRIIPTSKDIDALAEQYMCALQLHQQRYAGVVVREQAEGGVDIVGFTSRFGSSSLRDQRRHTFHSSCSLHGLRREQGAAAVIQVATR